MKRRDFIASTGIVALGASSLLSGCPKRNTFSNATLFNGDDGSELRVHRVEFSTKLVKEEADKKYILLKHPEHRFPICLFQQSSEYSTSEYSTSEYSTSKQSSTDLHNTHQYHAILMRCTHQNCQTSVEESGIVCPCHGSRFTETGKLIKGPAEKDLETFDVQIKGDNIIIKLV